MNRSASIAFRCGVLASLALAIGLSTAPTPALGAWSAVRTVGWSATAYGVVMATDARGDTALAWRTEQNVGLVRTRSAVNVAFIGAGGRVAVRTLWRSSDALLGGVVVALDAQGELTVAWIAAPRGRSGATLSSHTIYAAYRSPSGRWSAVQTVGYSGPFLAADLRLAVAPDREVLLTWRGHTSKAPGVAAAWRQPGRGFAPYVAVSRSKSAVMFDPTPVFDSDSAAHVYGTVSCGRGIKTCVTMVSTGARSHRFAAPLVIAPAPAEFPVVSFSAPGRALIAWEAGDFEGLEPYFAAPYARVMRSGSLTAPVALQPSSASVASSLNAVAANEGGGTVSWSGGPSLYPGSARVMLAVGDASGRFSAASASPSGLMPALRDGAGDVVLRLGEGSAGAEPVPSPVALQPVAGGPVQASPMPLAPTSPMATASASFAGMATVQPLGAGAAVAWISGATLDVSTWRP